jgi:RNA polymerase sigma factor (sigma-70 family)
MRPCTLRIASAEKIIKATSLNDLLVEHAPWCRTTPNAPLLHIKPPERASGSHGNAHADASSMMHAVTIPPFETFYAEHSPEVLGLLRRKLGRDRADDAFQETFLRALRAYDRLEHGEHLRAWVLTIASRVAIDVHRRTKPTTEVPDIPHEDARPAYEDLGELTNGLPPKERAAVVLRYGYDLTYEQIAGVLDSSPDAARQAASTGVRRLRKEKTA